ncbi:hypothetical protein ALO54_100571 [Pseudomonas syringae pv. philadelphi]|nr:hypothetical protein ALO86_100498 [Pseudomonas syringae pv. berberidis]KPY13321.1 hypothetical protein ALO54_100571 [Pseudomonas syringae pv. philadelphi]RMM28776.1 hypothetical protein ALQ83_100573 [Pseudomonas syringae pv. berberidis]RMP71055.1 hypothetical protein ALQ19_100594 [Pseudomonas syringae pv. berberidis]RMQ33639.1 hypothetical protein ALQ06_100558 [Pseudomonas syringae pv. berberidis]
MNDRLQQQSTDCSGSPFDFCGSEKAAHHTSSVSGWLPVDHSLSMISTLIHKA